MPTAKCPTGSTRRVVLASLAAASLGLLAGQRGAVADEAASPTSYLEFVREQARAMRSGDRPPTSLGEWRARGRGGPSGTARGVGGFPDEPCPLDAQVLGTLDRDGYRVEKVVFQTRPGVRMTANAYVPRAPAGGRRSSRPRPLARGEAGPGRPGPLHRCGEARLLRPGR